MVDVTDKMVHEDALERAALGGHRNIPCLSVSSSLHLFHISVSHFATTRRVVWSSTMPDAGCWQLIIIAGSSSLIIVI